jgi:hypothetical protein
MLKKTLTYTDYEGVERKEDFYFNLNKAELLEMELSEKGGVQKLVERLIAEEDSKRIIELFKDLILKACGVKSPDGKRFIKTPEIRDAFSQSEAYVELFMELATNSDSAVAFVNGIMPQNMPTTSDHLTGS